MTGVFCMAAEKYCLLDKVVYKLHRIYRNYSGLLKITCLQNSKAGIH